MSQKQFIIDAYDDGDWSYDNLVESLVEIYGINRKQAVANIRRVLRIEERMEMKGRDGGVKAVSTIVEALLDAGLYKAENNPDNNPDNNPEKAPVDLIDDVDPAYIHYVAETDIYRTYLRCIKGEHQAVSGEDVRLAKRMYSNWKQSGKAATVGQVCQQFGWNRSWFVEFKRRMGWTHDQDPLTDEEHKTLTPTEKNESLVMMERAAFEIATQKINLKKDQEDAQKWRDFSFQTLEPMRSLIEEEAPVPDYPRKVGKDNEKFVVFAPQDLHVGKMGWNGEGSLAETRELLLGTTDDLIRKTRRFLQGQPPQVILVLGSDWWNADNVQGATSSLTPQDQSVPPEVAFKFGMRLQKELIELLRAQLGPVRVFVIPGNHDRYSCQAAHCYLEALYGEIEDVQIEGNSDNYQFAAVGDNLLGFHHGDGIRGGRTKRPEAHHIKMSNSRPALWGQTTHRTQFGGHLHGFDVKDEGGVRYIQTPSLSFDDRWHEQKSFDARIRGQNCFIFDHNDGLESIMLSDARYI